MILKLIMLVGLSGSGKSHMAKELAESYNATVFSSDELRQELYGDVNDQTHNDQLFKELHKRIRECLLSGKSAIYDATNLNYKHRMAFLQSLNRISCEKIAAVMATPYEICLGRNKQRERQVPEYVIKRMYLNFTIPYYYEGFDYIRIMYAYGTQNSFDKPSQFISNVMNFNQDNPHHTMTLGKHCAAVGKYLKDKKDFYDNSISWELIFAGLLHDNGKVFTKAFVNSKCEPSESAHYYQHQCCGAYDSLFYEFPFDHLHVAALIQWHMRPYLAWDKSEKAREKDRKLLGEKFYNEVMLLHEADVAAK